MLVLGKAGSAGTGKGVLPVLRDGTLVATLHASNWKEAATATVGDRTWAFAKRKRELTGRWASEPEGVVRLRARQTSAWKGTWHLDLDGVPVQASRASRWRNTRRYLAGGRQLAESGSTGGWSPKPTLTTDPTLSLDHAVFLLWVELLIRRRAAALAATTAAAGGAVTAG
jgi:hypothetical protein